MNQRIQFQEKLRGILDMARAQQNRVTTEEVEHYFEEEQLTDAQTELVYDYLLSQKVAVSGYEKKGGRITDPGEEEKFTEEEKAYLKDYERDIKAIRPVSEEEQENLFQKAKSGDALAKSRLVEGYLSTVVELAKQNYHPEVFLGDMIQEGNVSLMLALDMLPEEDADRFVRREIAQSMQALAEEQQETKKRDNRMVEKVNELDAGITKLTEEMGRKVTIEELAVFLDMPLEEIVSVMQLAGEEIALPETDPEEVLHVPGAGKMKEELLDGFEDMKYEKE